MSNLVRLFTCASVLSLGGLTAATASIVACSSDTTSTTPAGDDDDDATNDAGTQTGNKDAGGGTNTDAGGGRPASCAPAGTYEMQKTAYKVTTAGAVCDNYAAAGNKSAQPYEVTISKVDEDNYTMKLTGSTSVLNLLLANDKCQLGGAEQPYGQDTIDADKKPITVKLSPTHLIDFDGANITDNVSVPIESDPPTPPAPGTPCILGGTTKGTKK